MKNRRPAVSTHIFSGLICLQNSLAEVPHAHGVASGGVEEGASGVEGDLVDLALSWWDG